MLTPKEIIALPKRLGLTDRQFVDAVNVYLLRDDFKGKAFSYATFHRWKQEDDANARLDVLRRVTSAVEAIRAEQKKQRAAARLSRQQASRS